MFEAINIQSILTDLSKLDYEDERKLRKLTDTFPYFNVGQLLLAMHMHQKSHLHVHGQLKKAAVYAPSRRVLYNLVHRTKLLQNIERIESNSSAIKVELNEKHIVIPNEEPAFDTPIKFGSIGNVSSMPISGDKQQHQEPLETRDLGMLEKEILSHAFSLGINEPTTSTPKKQLQKTETETETEELSFSDWLKAVEQDKRKQVEESPDQLIDKFIQEKPQIKRSEQSEFFSPIGSANLSLLDDDSFVTETLAKIYARQGNKSKAIAVYDQLKLKYPEKRTYFARLINELK